MAVFKCKMCGGSLEINDSQTTAMCDYCGTQQTLPKLDDEKRTNLYDRANHFRRNNEFDKAANIYENILNEENSDSEAYWSLVLCRYGIEYVEDPATHKRVPTVNRAQFTSIFDDDNYKSALKYADEYQCIIYEAEAKAINEIQKGILAISQREEPFDVFICYKETDNNGRRTQDSVLANELYHQLTNEGYKVFFSRITLEDKLGIAYEPYIFAALNSAKVMVVLGTKPEYFNAVWVKNEWSRYLALVKQSAGKKVLIPAYRDMDPYDLPEEFSHLQAQDMSKLGFMQDLLRGISKILKVEESSTITTVKEKVVSGGGSAAPSPLLRRAFMYLEDGEWESADEYCEKVLDLEPENGEAYLGKLLAEFRCRKKEDLKDVERNFDNSNNYKKAIRFSSQDLVSELKGYNEQITYRNEQAALEEKYNEALEKMNTALDEYAYQKVAELFEKISGYRDASSKKVKCLELAEVTRKDAIYRNAYNFQIKNTVEDLKRAVSLYSSVSGWKEANVNIDICLRRIEEIKIAEEQERLEREKQAEIVRKKEEDRRRIANRWLAIICVMIVLFVMLFKLILPGIKYVKAIQCAEEGKYDEAITAYTELGNFFGVQEKKLEAEYGKAIELLESGFFLEAYEALVALEGYKDSVEKANSISGEYVTEKLKQMSVGNYISFGTYEQDNILTNGKESIEWLILDVREGKALVISKYALDCQKYNINNCSTSWKNCTLQKWLNNDFLNAAFNESEKLKIATTLVPGDENVWNKVFLLSVSEANDYFDSAIARDCKITPYAEAQGADVDSYGSCQWWLRSSGIRSRACATFVNEYGIIMDDGSQVNTTNIGVRPALWIDFLE